MERISISSGITMDTGPMPMCDSRSLGEYCINQVPSSHIATVCTLIDKLINILKKMRYTYSSQIQDIQSICILSIVFQTFGVTL